MEAFEKYRPTLFAVAYKMTKSVADAEDIVQDIFIRFSGQASQGIQNPEAYWVKAVMNRCLDVLEKKKHIQYVGIDLPEPMFRQRFEQIQGHDVSYALLLLLQKLNPEERAVFILRETLDYDYAEIAETLGLQEANCRQLMHRAKEKMAADKVRNIPTAEERSSLVNAFVKGVGGDVQQLVRYLKEDIVIYSDGGGKVAAARFPIVGLEKCLLFLNALYTKFGHTFYMEPALINGEPGVILRKNENHEIETVMVPEFDNGQVSAFYFIRNPDKLGG